jgi:ATP-dependent protease ClpP protease subunit
MSIRSWYTIVASAGTRHAEIMLYDPIGRSWWEETTDAKTFVAELNDLDVDTLELRINSPGGDVFDGVAIFNALRKHQARVTCRIEGLAASIASVIALAGDEVVICENAMMMIHNASTYAGGNAADLRKTVEMLEQVDQTIITTYATKTGQDREWLAGEMAREAWYTAAEAVEHGFANTVADDEADLAAVAAFDPRVTAGFRNPPAQVAALLTTPAPPAEPEPAAADADAVVSYEVEIARARREREQAAH